MSLTEELNALAEGTQVEISLPPQHEMDEGKRLPEPGSLSFFVPMGLEDAEDGMVAGAMVSPPARRLDAFAASRSAIRTLLPPVLAWWTTSTFVVLQYKQLVAGSSFPHAFALSGCTNLLAGAEAWFAVRLIAQRYGSPPMARLSWRESLQLGSVGLIQGVGIALANKALEYLSVSTRTMVNSSSVLFMMTTARAWRLEGLGFMRLAVAALVMVGGGLQGLDHLAGEESGRQASAYVTGVLLQLLALFFSAQKWAFLQWTTQRSPIGSPLAAISKSKMHLAARTMTITGLVCLLFSFCFEWQDLQLQAWPDLGVIIKALLVATGIAVLVVAELEIVRTASAVALEVISVLHQIPIALAGVALFQDEVHPLSWTGFLFCLLAALCYARVRFAESQKLQSPEQEETQQEMVQRVLLET